MRQLNGFEIDKLKGIILNTFDPFSFPIFFTGRLNRNFTQYVVQGVPFDYQIYSVIQTANREGWQGTLISALIAERPDTTTLLEIGLAVGLTEGYDTNPAKPIGLSGLQNLINGDPMLDPEIFIRNLQAAKRCVCRVQSKRNDDRYEFGTGFLISSDLVLTNYHVVEHAINEAELRKHVTCRFDFEANGAATGVPSFLDVMLSDHSTFPAFRQYSNLDITGSPTVNAQWGEKNLDYAIMRLERAVGNDAFGPNWTGSITKVNRGWIKVPTSFDGLFVGGHMIILQHPDKLPIKIAFGFSKISDIEANGLRVRYDINTMPGSSGSPCFDQNFNWTALHNMGDPNINPAYNQGIPAELIVNDIRSRGINIG